MTVVLDMDETLIHTVFTGCSEAEYRKNKNTPKYDFFLDTCGGIAVHKRPGLHNFLKTLASNFEVVVFTAAAKEYADAVLDTIDPNQFISHRIYRDSCSTYKGYNNVKDLQLLGRDLSRTVMIDNTLSTFLKTPDNGVLCSDFVFDRKDRELPLLTSLLLALKEKGDVRELLKGSIDIRGMTEQLLQRGKAFKLFPEAQNSRHLNLQLQRLRSLRTRAA